jgi:hypothetical protein
MEVSIDADELLKKEVDDQGRIYIGRAHSGESVTIAIQYEQGD